MSRSPVVLIKPPEKSKFNFGAFSLGVLAAYIRDITDVLIIDATCNKPSEVTAYVWSLNPAIVGITVMGLGSIHSALRFLKSLTSSKAASTATILVGGHGVTGAPTRFLEAGATAVVTGEGEVTLRGIIEYGVEPGIPGIMCLSNGKLVVGPPAQLIHPLDRLPPPARDLIPPPQDGVHLLETSRGCPYRCAFCETTQFYGNTWRAFSPERVAAEVGRLIHDFGAWTILFADDNFAASPSRVIEICERLCRGSLPAVFLASVRADDLLRDPDVIPAMAKARILRITVGVETLDPEAAAAVGKPIPRTVYREAFARLRAHGIFSVASFIAGLPGQQADARDAVELAVEAGPDAAIFIPFIPMPGTSLAEGYTKFAPRAVDRKNAQEMTEAFFRHADVRQRLVEAEAAGGIRGLMARATASRQMGL